MDYFGHVYFGPNEREKQRKFLLAMNGAEIIKVTKEEVDEWYRSDIQHNAPGCDNHLVLHGEEQKNRFGYIMDTFFPDKHYDITEEPGSKEFKAWLHKKSHEKHLSK